MNKELEDNITAAVSNGRTDIVRTLITTCEKSYKEADGVNNELTPEILLNGPCTQYGSLLHLATKLDHADIVRTLLSAGADPSIQNTKGETPYDLAATDRMTTVYVEELLKAAARSETDRICQLIEAGVTVNSLDSTTSGNTPLHWAASFGNVEAVKCLLDHNASVNFANMSGATPLHDAVCRKDLAVIEKLLEAGANPLHKSEKGKYADKTPVDLAGDQQEVANLLLSYSSTFLANNKENNGNTSLHDLSTDSLSSGRPNGLTPNISHLSLVSSDSPMKQSLSSYNSQPADLPEIPVLTSPPPLITDCRLYLLWPLPQKIVQTEGPVFKLTEKLPVHIIQNTTGASFSEIVEVWNTHEISFKSVGFQFSVDEVVPCVSTPEARVLCHLNYSLFDKQESYKIITSAAQIRILASDLLGLHYAVCTIVQLLRLYHDDEGIPPLYIYDWPSLQRRAVLVDLSSGSRKPTLNTLKGHIRILSSLKIRQLHYNVRFEPKEGYQSAYNSRDLIELERYCNEQYISLIPAIDVRPDVSYEELKQSSFPIQKFLASFSSKELHIGPNLSKILVNASLEKMDIRLLWTIFSLPSDTLIFMSSQESLEKPEILKMLPLNVVLVEYGYEVTHDFDFAMRTIIYSGISACVCAGTSSWNSLAGCPETAISNIYKASQAASSHNALGLIVADWSGSPHHTALCFSWPGLILSAGLAWNHSIHWDYLQSRLPELLNLYVLQDKEQVTGYLTVELGRLEAYIHRSSQHLVQHKVSPNSNVEGSVLHQLLVNPDSVLIENLRLDLFQQAIRHIKRFEFDLQKAKPDCFQKGEVVAELQLAIELLLFSCRLGRLLVSTGLNPSESPGVAVINVGVANLPPTSRTDLANRLLALTEQFRAVWLSRNLPCGLHASLFLFNTLLHKLIANNDQSSYQGDNVLKQQLFTV